MGVSTNAILFYGYREPGEEAWDEYLKKRRDNETWAEEQDEKWEGRVGLDFHCSASFPVPYIYAFRIVARRGYPSRISDLAIRENWEQDLLDYLKEYNLTVIEKPDWYIASYWGE